MRKIISILLCIILVCSISAFSVKAATNYCELFQSEVRWLRWSMNFNGANSVEEGKSFDTAVIMDFIKMKIMDDYVDKNGEYSNIPAAVFEAKAKSCFAIVDVNALRSFEEDYWDYEAETMAKRKIYDSEKNAYVFVAAGGAGDSTTYAIRGYIKNGNKYTVYSHFIDLSEEYTNATGTEGKDYFVYEGAKYGIMHSLKNIVETDGKDVKFHSWQQVSAVPSVNGMITPSTKVEDNKPTESKPTTSTPATSKPAESKPTTSTPATSTPNGDNVIVLKPPVSSEQTTSEETKPLVTVAKTETAKLETEEKVFPENTVVTVEEIKESKAIENLKTALKEFSEKFVAYEITAECKNVAVQPNGKVKATFNIPEGYDLDKVAVYYVADDGKTEKLASSVDKNSKTVVAELSHFSTYVVAETNTVQTSPEESTPIITYGDTDTEKGNGALLWVIIVIVAAVVIGGGVACFFIFKKKA